jgi:hypothetical protein
MSTRSQPRRGTSLNRGCMALFFLVFLIAGAAATYVALVRPLVRLFAARSWTETQCDIVSSRVAVSGSSRPTYRVDIRYTWTAGGSPRSGNRYDFMTASSSGTAGKQKIVDAFPPGARVPCWVDPDHPDQAVLSLALSSAYLIGLAPLIFVAIGFGGLALAVRPGRAAAYGEDDSPYGVPLPATGTAPAELKPEASRVGMFFGLLVLALFWNGMVAALAGRLVTAWRQGQPTGCMALFLVPFALIGLGLIYGVGRQLLALFNPRPHLKLTPGVLIPGESAHLQWRLGSGGGGVRRVKIVLEGRKEGMVQSGASHRSTSVPFSTQPLVNSTQPAEIAGGGAVGFTLPAELPPSFEPGQDKIIWSLKVHCELALWPDSDDEFDIAVRPPGWDG